MDVQKRNNILILLGIIILGSVMIFTNLDRSLLWQDEGETACVSRTIFQYGIPKGTDGLNSFSQQQGKELGPNGEWKLHPWFQFYWSAAFMSFMPDTTFSLRFPFALLGLGSIVLIYFLALEMFEDRKTAIFAALLLSTNVFFLLLSRQVRYYPAVTFFILLGLHAYFKSKQHTKFNKWDIIYVLAGVFLFTSQYFYGIALWGGVLVFHFVKERPSIKKILILHGILAAVCIPYLIWMLDSPYAKALANVSTSFIDKLGIMLGDINSHIMSFVWLIILVGVVYYSRQKKASKFKDEHLNQYFLLLGIALFSVLIFAFTAQEVYMRYLCGTIPLLLLVCGRLLSMLTRQHNAIAVMVLLIALYLQGLPQYISKEMQEDYMGPVKAIVAFLERESKAGDQILIPYGDLPLKYYLPDRIYTGGHTAKQPQDGDEFDFIVVRKMPVLEIDYNTSVWIQDNLNPKTYDLLGLEAVDNAYENRETPTEHVWEAPIVTDENRVLIARRRPNSP